MKTLSILLLLSLVFVLAACIGGPAAEDTPTQAVVETEEVVPTPTSPPEPTSTPVPPPTEAPVPTDTPVPTDVPPPTEAPAPTDTQAPAPVDTAEPVVEEEATLEPLPPLALLEPMDGETCAGEIASVNFVWTEASRPLAEDEYYVLIVTHRDGKDFTWLKDNSFSTLEEKQWYRDFGPELSWQVVVAQQRTGDANEDPTGAETSEYSTSQMVRWN